MMNENLKVNLVWDNWNDNGPLPNGLHPKYINEWDTKWKDRYDINVLTRFIPLDRYNLGFFPLLCEQANINVTHIKPEDIGANINSTPDWYIMEPNHMDLSLITENMFGNISEHTLGMLRDGKVKLVLYYAFEAFPVNQVNWINVIERSLGWLKIPKENFILIFGDQKFDENYKKYLSSGQGPFYEYFLQNVFVYDHFAWEFSDYIKNMVIDTDKEKKEIVSIDGDTQYKPRPKKFLCLNGGGRPHRKWLMTELKRNNLMQHGLVSYLNKFDIPYDPNQFVHKPIKKGTGDTSMLEVLDYHMQHGNNIEEIQLDIDPVHDAWHNRGMTVQHYKDTYFNITTETWPAEPSFFVTEKIFKPIINMQPFILVGHPGLLQYLHDEGYETFDQIWFDEHYDTITDHKQRFFYVMENIKTVCSLDNSELQSKYVKVWDRLRHNRKVFLEKNHTNYWRELIQTMLNIE